MEMITQEYAGMPGYAWLVIGAFAIFIISRIVKSNKRKRGGSGGGGRGGSGGNIKRH